MKTVARLRSLIFAALAVVSARSALAQQNFVPGFAGLKDGSQAPPGLFASVAYWNLDANTLIVNGTSIRLHPGVTQQFGGIGLSWVTTHKLWGGDYGATALFGVATSRVELDEIRVNSTSDWGVTSTYLQPLSLGWHLNREDVLVGYAVYLPTGRYTFGASNNSGLGMWTQELSAGTTVYFNAKKKSPHLALTLYYDINSEKHDTTFTQSNPLTLEGGLGANYGGKTFAGWAGIVGFAQGNVTQSTFRVTVPAPLTLTLPRSRSFGLGPEVTTLMGALTLRYLWEFGGNNTLQGRIAVVSFAYPIVK